MMVTPNEILVNNAQRRVYKILTTDSDEVIGQRYMASIGPVTTCEGRAALLHMKRDLHDAIRLARQNGLAFIRWEETEWDGYGAVSEERMNRKDEDERIVRSEDDGDDDTVEPPKQL